MTIQLNFSDPSLISPKISQEDKLEIIFKEGELFRSTDSQKYLPDNYVLKSSLPRQIVQTKQIKTLSDMISGGSKAMTYLVIGNIALQLFMSFSMHLLWGMMNNLQLMGKMLKFNVDVPSNVYIFFKYIDEFLNIKLKFIQNYLEQFNMYVMKNLAMSTISEKDQSNSIIENLGTVLLGSTALVFAMILTAVLIKYSRIPFILKITDALKNKLFYNSILRTGVQSYLQFCIIAFASLDQKNDQTTLAFGIIFLLLSVFFLLFTHFFLWKNQKQLADPNFQLRFNSLYLNCDTNIPHSYMLTSIFLGRRFLLGIILSFCDDHQDVQFFYMNFTSFLIIIYLVKVKPLVSSYLNGIEIFNEIILYGCTGLIWGMSNYQGDMPAGLSPEQFNAAYNSKQNQIGWAYIIMASTTITTTIGGIFINFLIVIRTKLQGKCSKRAVVEPKLLHGPDRNQDFEIKKHDDSIMIQNKSIIQDQINNFQAQKDPGQNNQQEIRLDEPSPYIFDSYEQIKVQEQQFAHDNFQNQIVQPSQYLIEIEDKNFNKKESRIVTASEFKTKLEKMKNVYNSIKVPSQQTSKLDQQQPESLLKDIFVAKEETFRILKEQSELAQIVYELGTVKSQDS